MNHWNGRRRDLLLQGVKARGLEVEVEGMNWKSKAGRSTWSAPQTSRQPLDAALRAKRIARLSSGFVRTIERLLCASSRGFEMVVLQRSSFVLDSSSSSATGQSIDQTVEDRKPSPTSVLSALVYG